MAWLLFAALGPSTCVQVAGWSAMLVRGLADRPAEALQRTFDGRHPCCMCRTADALRASEEPLRRAPVAERWVGVHLAPPTPMPCLVLPADPGTRMPAWPPVARLAGEHPDPEDPVPRRRG